MLPVHEVYCFPDFEKLFTHFFASKFYGSVMKPKMLFFLTFSIFLIHVYTTYFKWICFSFHFMMGIWCFLFYDGVRT